MVLTKEERNSISTFTELCNLIDKSNTKTEPGRKLVYTNGRLHLVVNNNEVIDMPFNENNWKAYINVVCDLMLTHAEKMQVYPELYDEQGRMWI